MILRVINVSTWQYVGNKQDNKDDIKGSTLSLQAVGERRLLALKVKKRTPESMLSNNHKR